MSEWFSCPNCSIPGIKDFKIEKNDINFSFFESVHKNHSGWGMCDSPEPTIQQMATQVLKDSDLNVVRANEQAKRILEKQNKIKRDEQNTHSDIADSILQDNHFKTLEDTEKILFYENGVYNDNGEIKIKKICENLILNCNTNTINEVIATIKRKTYTSRDEFDKDEFEICLYNCIINVKTGLIIQHSPEKLFRSQLPITFDKNAICPKFIKFLQTTLPAHDDYIDKLEAFACGLLKNNPKLEAMFFDTGKGDNGKSTFYKIVNWFYGDTNVSTVSIHELIQNKFAKSRLENKRVNTFPDIESDALDDFGILKALVSGDAIDAEFKYQNPYTFRSYAKLFFSANELPEIKEKTFATFKRIRLTKWNQSFVKPNVYQLQKDILKSKFPEFTENELVEELALNGVHLMNKQFVNSILEDESEKSGILNLLLIVVRHLIRRDGFFNDYTHDQLNELWTENSTLIETFAKDCLVKDTNHYVTKTQVYQAYYSYCKANGKPPKQDNIVHPILKTLFNIEHIQKRISGKIHKIYDGLAWNLENPVVKRLQFKNESSESSKSRNYLRELSDFTNEDSIERFSEKPVSPDSQSKELDQ